MAHRRSELLDKTPPHNIEAERAVIGSICLKPDILQELSTLTASDFHATMYGILFRRLSAMHNSGLPIDAISLAHELKRNGELAENDRERGKKVMIADIAECMQSVPVADHAGYYARLIRETSFRRRVIRALVLLVQRAYDSEVSVEELRGTAGKLLEKITAYSTERPK